MNPELESMLIEKHSLILRRNLTEGNSDVPYEPKRSIESFSLDKKNTGIYDAYTLFGIECEDGWFNLLDELLTKLESLVREEDLFAVNQIKEKLGGLRFYYYTDSPNRDAIRKLVDEYEKKSLSVCEICGKEGSLVETRGLWTLCKKHFEEKSRDLERLY